MLSSQQQIIGRTLQWLGSEQSVWLCTILKTWGSSPRPVGSHLAICEDGNFFGSVSGGCIEGAVITEAIECMQTGETRKLEFGVSDEQAWEVGLSCGGAIQVLVVPVSDKTLISWLLISQLISLNWGC